MSVRDFFETFSRFFGTPGPEARETFFQTFWGFRARRARETPVARRRVRKSRGKKKTINQEHNVTQRNLVVIIPWKCPGDSLQASPGTSGTSRTDLCVIPQTVRAEIITELFLKRAGPVIFKTFLLELIAFRPIPVVCPARGEKPENYWKR